MAVMILQNISTDKLAIVLTKDFPHFTFIAGDLFYWSPNSREIFYQASGPASSLLHELGHALLGHKHFSSDIDLLHKEVAAWEKARELARTYRVGLDDRRIEACLDGYRDWLHARSTCPTCGTHGMQPSQSVYRCLNCGNMWNVSASVLCRAYRQRKRALNTK